MSTHTHAPAAIGQPVRIDPDGWYTDADLRIVLRMPSATLTRARREGALRHTRRGVTAWHRGQWVIDWLSGDSADETVTEDAHA